MATPERQETNDRPPPRKARGAAAVGRPVPLHKRSSSHFRPTVRERGKQDLEAGRVALEIDAMRARARVEGADKNTYAVGLDWSRVEAKRALHAFCECRRFAAGKPCEHVWATLLALAGSNQGTQPPGRDRVSLRKDRASAWDDLGVSPEALAVAVAVEEQPPRRRATRHGRAASSRHPSTSWRSQLDSLRAEVGRLSSPMVAAPTAADASVSTRFLVNTAASRNNGGLVLDVFTRRIGPGGKPGKLKRTGVEPDDLSSMLLPKGTDFSDNGELPVITALATAAKPRQGRARRGKQKNNRIQRFRLPQRLHEPVLSHLASLGVLGSWDGRRLSDGGALAWDTGRPWRLTLRLAAGSGGAKLVGSLERNGESVALTAPLLILPTTTPGRSLVVFGDSIGRLSAAESELHWITLLRDTREIVIPERDLEDALTELLEPGGGAPDNRVIHK